MNLNNQGMRSPEAPDRDFENFAIAAFDRGAEFHGELGLSFAAFRARLVSIAYKNLRAGAEWWAVCEFTRKLHTDDLYLAIACAARNEAAWQRFSEVFRKPLRDLHQFLSQGLETASDLADQTLIDMFLPDRSGQSRIASYDGRSSVMTWLRVIVGNRAINERQRACNRVRRVEPEREIVDSSALEALDSGVRSERYYRFLHESLKQACHELTTQDRLILLWRYEKGLQLGQIARLIGVHQSTVTRQLERMLERLRGEVVEVLTSRYQMTQDAVDECLETVVEQDHSMSVLQLVRESAPAGTMAELERAVARPGNAAATRL
jgi:RNA polymerase sigma-70 factor